MESIMTKNAQTKKRRYFYVFTCSFVLLIALILCNIAFGSVGIPVSSIVTTLWNGTSGDAGLDHILLNIRLPRLIAALMLGGALSLSGFLLQTYFNNPIAGPFVLGISSGAKLFVSALIVFVIGAYRGVSSAFLVGSAYAGALFSMGLVLLISRKTKRSAVLIVSGVMVGYICTALTDFIITFASDASIVNLHNWSKGTFSGTSWSDVGFIFAFVGIASILTFALSKPISAYQLGESYALSVGVNTRLFRVVLILLSSFLSATVTAFAGPISFVGIAMPHIARATLNTSKPLLVLPLSFIGGSIFCLFCDLLARTMLAPSDLSISSVTAVVGAPLVIAIMMKKRMKTYDE